VASSLIQINEATLEELQQLKGIGPKRASYIEQYRREVSQLAGNFDLAAATGLSLKAVEDLAPHIDWRGGEIRINFWPILITVLASFFLIYIGFDEVTKEPFSPPASYYNLGLALILIGGFAATGDATISAIARHQKKTPVWRMSVAFFTAGFAILIALVAGSSYLDYSESFGSTIRSTINFLWYCLIMACLQAGPAFCLHHLSDEDHIRKLGLIRRLFDLALLIVPALFVASYLLHNSSVWIEEIFGAWCITILTLGSLELLANRSAFDLMLNDTDKSRFRFIKTRASLTQDSWEKRKVLGIVLLCEIAASAVIVLIQ
jgi:hypothetical protein